MIFRLVLLLCSVAAAYAACGCSPGYQSKSSLPVPDPETGLVEGDMKLTSNNYLEMMGMRNIVLNTWPRGIVHYSIASGDRAQIESALWKLQEATGHCVRFVRRTNQEAYIEVINGDGCWSFIGRTGRKQQLSLQMNGCYYEGTIQHEFIHALGFFHEQSRTDRDNFVNIYWQNINSKFCHNFNKQGKLPSAFEKYDYLSVMHYGSGAFACTAGQRTITRKDGGRVGGSRVSSGDVKKIRQLYKCG